MSFPHRIIFPAVRSLYTFATVFSLILLSFTLKAFSANETGMCIVSSSNANWGSGPIYRIDVISDVVQTRTNSLGNGNMVRFSPDGKRIAYFKNGGSPVSITTIDGQEQRTFACTSPDGWYGQITWSTDNAIWVGTTGKIVKYDTLGNQLASYTFPSNVGRGMVSRAENTITATQTNYRPVIFQLNGTTLSSPIYPTISGDGCSVCPSPNGLYCTNNLRDSPNGIHRSMRVLDRSGNVVTLTNQHSTTNGSSFYIQDITQFSGTDCHLDGQCWSGNSNDWIVIPTGQGADDVSNNGSPCIYNISTQQKICFKDNLNTSTFWTPFDYYSGWYPGAATPVLQLSPTTLNFSADSGTTNPVAQNITATTSSGTLTGLTVSGANSWVTISPATTSGASIAISTSVKIAGLAPATYRDTINVSTTNAGSKTYYIVFTVTRPPVIITLDSMRISPKQYTVSAGQSISFLATCKDLSHKYIAASQFIRVWSTSGGGTIDQTGKYTASATPTHGPHLVIVAVTMGSVTLRDTAKLMVTRPVNASLHKRIDCGLNTLVPTGWEIDDTYLVSGGNGQDRPNLSTTVATTGVMAAAPADVYKSLRRGNAHSYLVPQLPTGPYTVRMHFIDPADSVRKMIYSILGAQVLNDFTISALAGGANKALVMDFPVTVQDNNGMPIVCSGSASTDDVFEAGLEIMQGNLKQMTLLSPLGGEKYTVGQTVQIRFANDTTVVRQVYIKLSINDGLTFNNFTGAYGIKLSDYGANWGTYNWTIPETLSTDNGRIPTVSTKCAISIEPYTNGTLNYDASDSAFTISKSTTFQHSVSTPGAKNQFSCTILHDKLSVSSLPGSPYVAEVYNLAGACITSWNGNGTMQFALPMTMNKGMFVVRVTSGKAVILTKAIIQ